MTYIENVNIHLQGAPGVNAPDIVMTDPDFIAGYEQAVNSRPFRATRFFTDADIVGIIQDFLAEKIEHDEAEVQWHAGQLTGLIMVRCMPRAYPREIDARVPLQGHPYAPQQAMRPDIEAPEYGSLVYSSEWPEGMIDVVLDKTKERGIQLELSFVPHTSVDAQPTALLHLKMHDIIALRDFLNQATVTRWLQG
jgi:hypothetical protein